MSTHTTPGSWLLAADLDAVTTDAETVDNVVCEAPPRHLGSYRYWPANAALIASAKDHAMVARGLADGTLRWEPFQFDNPRGELCFQGMRHCAEIDEFGVPKLTDHLRAALAKANPLVNE